MASQEIVTELRAGLDTVTRFTELELIQRRSWGDITFETARRDIELVLAVGRDLSQMPLEYLTEQAATSIRDVLPEVAGVLQEIDQFTLEGDVSSNRDHLMSRMRAAAENLHRETAPWIPYLAYQRGDVQRNMDLLQGTISEAEQTLDAAKADVQQKRKAIDQIVSAAREAAADAGVATFTTAFSDEADRIAVLSRRWLVAAAAGAVLTLLAAFVSFFWPSIPEAAGTWDIVRAAFTKVSVLGMLITATIWCARMYRALVHQRSVNRHRALSLQTFQAFAAATADDRIKDAVLMAATNSIFDNVATGLVDQNTGRTDPAVQFVEIGKATRKMAEGAKTE